MEEQRTILVVDDEPEVSSVLESALDAREYRIRSVSKWTEAIAEIHETPPDIVLLDLYLPTVQGEALLEFIKDQNLNFPVVIVSSEIDPGKMQQLGQLGASGFVRKPFEEDDLVVVVEQVLAMWGEDLAQQAPSVDAAPPGGTKGAAEPIVERQESAPATLAVSPGAGVEQLQRDQPVVATSPERHRRQRRRPRSQKNRNFFLFLFAVLVILFATWLLFSAQELLSDGFFGIDIDTGP